MSVPNQKTVQIARRTPRDKEHLYAMMNIDALKQAIEDLNGSGLKMWLYLNKNQDNYRFELSRQACAEWGIRKDSYYNGLKELEQKGYLHRLRPGSNTFIFYEAPQTENPPSGYSEFYLMDFEKGSAENKKNYYGNQNYYPEKPYRNNIYNTGIINDRTASERQKEEERKWQSFRELGF